jgi:hypothetical protein
MRRGILAVVAGSLLIGGLAGCTPVEPPYFEQPVTPLPDGLDLSFEFEGARFQGSHDGFEVYLAEGVDRETGSDRSIGTCLIVGEPDDLESWVAACSAGGWVSSRGPQGPTFEYQSAGFRELSEGATLISEFVIAK